jgi:hypothetical protein
VVVFAAPVALTALVIEVAAATATAAAYGGGVVGVGVIGGLVGYKISDSIKSEVW